MSGAPSTQTLRVLPIAKAILLSIITLGIYFLITVYRNTKDIQTARAQPFAAWQLVFWLSVFLPFVGVINYAMNGVGLSELRSRRNLDSSIMWVVALVLAIMVPPVGQIVWAVHYNDTLSETGHGTGVVATSTA